jgi:hypothetical protein
MNMERPFDYVGRHSDIYRPDENDLRPANGSTFHYGYDACGGNSVTVTGWLAPEEWSDEDIREIVSLRFPAEFCHHEYDCCGKYYPEQGQVIAIEHDVRNQYGDRCHLVMVLIRYVQNV